MIATGDQTFHSLWKSRWLSLLLLLADTIGFSLAWTMAYHTRVLLNEWFSLPINDAAPYMAVHGLIVLVALINSAMFGLYIHRRRFSSLNQPSVILKAGYHWLLYIIVVGFLFKELDLGRSVILLASVYGLIYLFTSRTIFKTLKAKALKNGRGTVRTGIVGSPNLALEVKEAQKNHPEIGYSLLGLISDGDLSSSEDELLEENQIEVLGPLSNLTSIVERYHIEELFLAIAHLDKNQQFEILQAADVRGISVHAISDIFGVINESAKVDEIGTFPVITLRDGHLPLHQGVLKRLLDLAASGIGIILWLMFIHWWVALWIKASSPGPVFFTQKRVGKEGRHFKMFKYRTMRTDADPYAVAPTCEEDPRITRVGRWLRRTSIDEFPQLLNVFLGQMSMVGPRPEMPFIVENYEPWERRRLDVKPGVTGLWQVVGRKNLPLHLNMQYDFYYIKNQSFLLDLEILVRTVPAVLKGKGAF